MSSPTSEQPVYNPDRLEQFLNLFDEDGRFATGDGIIEAIVHQLSVLDPPRPLLTRMHFKNGLLVLLTVTFDEHPSGDGGQHIDIDRILDENAEQEILELLTADGPGYPLEQPAHGIARQVLARGRESLTERQASVFDRFVAGRYFNLECERCHVEMPTSEVAGALMEDDGLCSCCRHMQAKDD